MTYIVEFAAWQTTTVVNCLGGEKADAYRGSTLLWLLLLWREQMRKSGDVV